MKRRTLLLTALMILSVAVAGIGSTSAMDTSAMDTSDSVESIQQTNTLTIVGTGPEALYTFSVTDDLRKAKTSRANINRNDEIRRGYVGDGEVGTGADSYTFSGELETIKVVGDAEVYLDGQRVSDKQVERFPADVLEVEGTGPAAQYVFSANGDNIGLDKLTANKSNLNLNDNIVRTTAVGEVGTARDAYGYDGDVASLDVDGDANVYVNGRPTNPESEQDHVITIVGSGPAANYQFSGVSDVEKSTANVANINKTT